MHILPEKLACVVSDTQAPVMGVMLRAEFTTERKNPYSIVFGPTDHEGRATLDRAAILLQAASQLNLALMDFEPLEGAFAGIVRVAIMQQGDLQNALRAFSLFKGSADFPAHYERDLAFAKERLRDLDARRLSVRVEVVPGSVKVLVLGNEPPS